MGPICESCMYFNAKNEECHANPPVPVLNDEGDIMWLHPPTEASNYCRYHEMVDVPK